MTVKEAMERLDDLKRLEKNMRLLKQYFLNEPPGHLEEIADAVGMDSTVNNTLLAAYDELSALAKNFEMAFLTSEINL